MGPVPKNVEPRYVVSVNSAKGRFLEKFKYGTDLKHEKKNGWQM